MHSGTTIHINDSGIRIGAGGTGKPEKLKLETTVVSVSARVVQDSY